MGHTPGPWFTTPSMPTRVLKQFRGGKIANELVCRTDYAWATEGERRANARLIAAAPELLEALESVLKNYVSLVNSGDAGNWNPEEEPEVQAALAAIAKATGE